MEADEEEAPLLCVLSDEQSNNSCLMYCLERGCRAQVFSHHGQIHRRHNDWIAALTQAGVYDVWVTAVFEANVAYGPFNGGKFFEDCEDHMYELLANMEDEDPALIYYWDGICEDNGWTSPEERGSEARARYLRTLPIMRPFRIKGLKVALSRWYSTHHAVDSNDKHVSTKQLGLATLCKRRGWINHIDDLNRAPALRPPPLAPAAAVPLFHPQPG